MNTFPQGSVSYKVAAKTSFKSWKRSVFTEVNEWAPKVHLLLYKNLEPSATIEESPCWCMIVYGFFDFLRAVEYLKK